MKFSSIRRTPWVLTFCCLTLAASLWAGETEWLGHLEKGKAAFDEGNYAEAREALEAAEKEAATTFTMTDPRAVDTTRLLAETNRLMDRVAVAEDLHKQLLGVLSLGLGDNDPATIGQHVELGRFYVKIPDFPKARDSYAKAYEAQKKDRAAYENWPAVAYEYAIVLFRLRDYAEAEAILTESVPVVRQQFGAGSLAVANLARALGEVQIALGDDAAAEPNLRQALEIYAVDSAETSGVAAQTIRQRLDEIALRDAARREKQEAVAAATEARKQREAAAAAVEPSPDEKADQVSLPVPEGWRAVAVFHGSEPTVTAPFRIQGRRWRMVWNTHATTDPKFASLGITVFRAGDSFGGEHLDIEGNTSDSAEYPGPGEFHLKFNTANVTYQVGVIESLERPTPSPLEVPASAEESVDQKALEDLINSYSVRYRTATTDLQRSSIRAKRARDLLAMMPENNGVMGWTGIVKARGTAADGSATLAIQLDGSRRVTVATHLLPEADKETRTLVPADSPLMASLASLKEGDRVRFAGYFLPAKNSPDGLLELSTTENASMTAPEFLMRFRMVQKVP
ncbi:MAG: hypothetical protein PWP23_3107 [Candidatus Sumerlaeota bacterium]|nr:hypothetical protein [Candidatus Sumerlaeota bacterium]